MKRLGYTFVTPSTGGHWANEFASAMEEYGAYSPDTAEELAPLSVTFTAPPSGAVWVQLSCDIFTQTAGTEHGYFGLKIAGGSSISGTKKEVSSAGPNAKRRVTYSHRITGLTPTTSYSYTWEWMADGADDVRSNQSDSTFTRPMFEVWEIATAAGGADATANPGAIGMAVSVPQASPTASSTVTPGAMARAVVIPQATPETAGNTTVNPALIARDFTIGQVGITAAATVSPGAMARAFVVPQATPSIGAVVSPALLTGAFVMGQVVVTTTGSATVTPASLTMLVVIPQALGVGAPVLVITKDGPKAGGAAAGGVLRITREGPT